MTISIGDTIPSATLKELTDEGMNEVKTEELFGPGRKVIVFSLPGAFTPTCSQTHLPGFVAEADALRAKGVSEIVCLAVNDAFVMKAWGDAQGATGKVRMLADGSAVFTKLLGLEQDLSAAGMGIRGKRFAMIVEDGKVKNLDVEEGRGVDVSGAQACMVRL
ncbi:MAG: peroxiredoxin [Myxococcales bacterium]|nr:peroxiredoxin [Myxococcales bacterium]